jgi:diguanylate cyclase (GGDEF)-like protein/PAS domain S-box-containing protein
MAHRLARERLLMALLDSAEEAILSISLDGTIETWSAGAERLYGYTALEMTGQSLSRLLPLYELQSMDTLLSQAGCSGCPATELGERLHKNGSRILLATRRDLIRGEKGEVLGILETARRLDSHEALFSPTEVPLRLLMEQVPGLLWMTDRNLRITSNWGAGFRNAKIGLGSHAGQNLCEFLECADRHATPIAEHCDALRGLSFHFEHPWKNRVLEIRVGPLRSASGEIIGCLAAALDITRRKKTEEQALYQARHDALTGLANYREFMDRLEREVLRAERSQRSFTLLLLDLDDLKRINDLRGHLVGNRALRRLAAVMNEHCRSTDLAARYGGDEFAVVLIDSDQGMAQNVAQRIEKRLRTDQEKLPLSVSIGIGVYPDDGRTPEELIEAADRRLYRHKKSHTQRAVSAP